MYRIAKNTHWMHLYAINTPSDLLELMEFIRNGQNVKEIILHLVIEDFFHYPLKKQSSGYFLL